MNWTNGAKRIDRVDVEGYLEFYRINVHFWRIFDVYF